MLVIMQILEPWAELAAYQQRFQRYITPAVRIPQPYFYRHALRETAIQMAKWCAECASTIGAVMENPLRF
jgi:hypothetical protein